jgi:hypothetical protein
MSSARLLIDCGETITVFGKATSPEPARPQVWAMLRDWPDHDLFEKTFQDRFCPDRLRRDFDVDNHDFSGILQECFACDPNVSNT